MKARNSGNRQADCYTNVGVTVGEVRQASSCCEECDQTVRVELFTHDYSYGWFGWELRGPLTGQESALAGMREAPPASGRSF